MNRPRSSYRRLLALADVDRKSQAKARVGLGFVYYQTNRFDRMKELDFESGTEFAAAAKVIRSFDNPPYRVKWTLDERTSEAPLLMVDPLPVMAVEYNGRPVHVLFDTGADMCILDSDLADQWGIKAQSSDIGAFGGGKLGRMGYGRLDSVKVGSVVLEGVPIWIMPTQKFSSAFADGKYPIGGIIGTGLIRQFLATLDYEHEKLVLRERSPRGRQTLRDELADRILAEVPFVLTVTHYMMARGSLDGRDGLTSSSTRDWPPTPRCRRRRRRCVSRASPCPTRRSIPAVWAGEEGSLPAASFPSSRWAWAACVSSVSKGNTAQWSTARIGNTASSRTA